MSDKKEGNSEWKDRELGVLWLSRSGKSYFGHITTPDGTKYEVVAFSNAARKKDGAVKENAPDIQIYKSVPRTDETATVSNDEVKRDLPPGFEN